MRKEEAEEIAAKLPRASAKYVKQAHMQTHFEMQGDMPATYAKSLGKSTGQSEFEPKIPSISEIHDKYHYSHVNYTVGGQTTKERVAAAEPVFSPKIPS